jgi:hypothetical protein
MERPSSRHLSRESADDAPLAYYSRLAPDMIKALISALGMQSRTSELFQACLSIINAEPAPTRHICSLQRGRDNN